MVQKAVLDVLHIVTPGTTHRVTMGVSHGGSLGATERATLGAVYGSLQANQWRSKSARGPNASKEMPPIPWFL